MKIVFVRFAQRDCLRKILFYVSLNPSRKSTNFFRHESEKYGNNFIYCLPRIVYAVQLSKNWIHKVNFLKNLKSTLAANFSTKYTKNLLAKNILETWITRFLLFLRHVSNLSSHLIIGCTNSRCWCIKLLPFYL